MTPDLRQDISDTDEKILNILKEFEQRQGFILEVNYSDRLFTSKLVKYIGEKHGK